MKYVKGISLFFVYPACCFLLGIMTGVLFHENAESLSEPESILTEPANTEDLMKQENILPEQYVMNPNAVGEVSQTQLTHEKTGYYVTINESRIIVYHGDRETVFLSTDIKAEELPEDVQADLHAGMYLENEGMLYDFLENYTS